MSDVTPSAETIELASSGCAEAVHRGRRLGWCEVHKSRTKDAGWPCPVAVDLATQIEARDRDVRADEAAWWRTAVSAAAVAARARTHVEHERSLLDLLAMDERRDGAT